MDSRRISIKDVAAHAKVSTATVSNVFSGRKPVNEDLRLRVRASAEALGYSADRAASQLRSGRTSVIAILIPDLTDVFFATIVSRLEMLATAKGFDVIVASSGDDPVTEASRLDALLAWRPAGIVAVPCSNAVPNALTTRFGKLPIVLVDRVDLPCDRVDTVTIDNRDAGEIAARHLIEHRHRDIVLAASRMDIAPIRERIEAAASLIESEVGRRPTIVELGSDAEAGTVAFVRWLERNRVPDAVLASTNVVTLMVLSAFAQHRIAIPDRASLVAFDDDAWMSARNTGLTAIRQPVEEIAQAAFDRLLSRMGEGGRNEAPRAAVFQASLVVRSSVASRRALSEPATADVRDAGQEAQDDPGGGGPSGERRRIH